MKNNSKNSGDDLYDEALNLNRLECKNKDYLSLRNSQMIRNLLCDLITTIITSEKKKRYDKLFKIKDEYHRCYTPSIKEFFFYDTLPYYQSLKLNNDKKLIPKEE